MIYQSIRPAVFLARPNRFIARVELDGREETVHVKTPGGAGSFWSPAVPCT